MYDFHIEKKNEAAHQVFTENHYKTIDSNSNSVPKLKLAQEYQWKVVTSGLF